MRLAEFGSLVAALVVAAGVGAGCGGEADPCAGFAGTCLAVHIDGDAAGATALEITTSGPVKASVSRPLDGASLPLAVALMLPDEASGQLGVGVVGHAGSGTVAVGLASVTVLPLRHVRAEIRLAPSRGDCHDGLRDGDEGGIDCGGSCATRCAAGTLCTLDGDCARGRCVAGHCGGYALSFADGVTLDIDRRDDVPPSLVVGTFDNSGAPDVVVAARIGLQLFTPLAAGGGVFRPSPMRFLPGGPYTDLASGDFDGDSHLDLAVTDLLGHVRIAFGDGNGQFPITSPLWSTGGQTTSAAVVADFDGDQFDDVAVVSYGWQHLAIVLGKNTHDANVTPYTKAIPIGGDAVAAGDLDGDGLLDLAVGSDDQGGVGPNEVYFLRGLGDGTFDDPVTLHPGVAHSQCFGVAIADFDEDGRADLIAGESSGRTLALFGSRDGGLGATPRRTAPLTDPPGHIAVADLDSDGHLDLAVIARAPASANSHVAVLLGHGDGTFADPVALPVGHGTRRVRAADLDHDGHPDLVACNASTDYSITILRNTSR